MGCSGGPDRGSSPKYVNAYPVSALIPDWRPPAASPRKIIPVEMVQGLREARSDGKSLRDLAHDMGVSHETIRAAVKERA